MSTATPNYGFTLPAVADPIDEDLWGTELNTNFSSLDTILGARTAGKYGAIIVQNATDNGFTTITSQGTAGQALVSNGPDALPSFGSTSRPFLHVRDQKSQGTSAGTFTNGDWRTRTLNTVVTNTIVGASVSSNQITLPAGTYLIIARAPGVQVDAHQTRLQNITDAATTIIGSNAYMSSANSTAQSDSVVNGQYTIAGVKVFELQHRCLTTVNTIGLGIAANFTTEVYSDVMIWQESA